MSMIATEVPLKGKDMCRSGYDSLYIDKKDIISAQLEAYNRLLKSVIDATDKEIIEKEIGELRIGLDLIP